MDSEATNDQMDRSFLEASISDLVQELSIQEKISLLAGRDFWSTMPIQRLNIPSVRVTDGPNGARGGSFFQMTPASALPNATCIGATFSTSLVEQAGGLLADETKARNATCLIAPTVNIQRSPLGGRAFESFSEDPTLSGHIAASYINGIQARNVSATIKHFVANDLEHERMGVDSIVDARALREVYLKPFQIAQRLSRPWAYMTSYNKLNGTHCSENAWLLQDLLRKEWGHEGLIMSDWFGTYSVAEAINAGLDLEMPGKSIWRDSKLVSHSLTAHKIDPRQLDKLVGEVLSWVQKLAKLNPDLVYAKPSDERTRMEERESDAALLRKIGQEGIVLLKNKGGLLPVKGGKDGRSKTVAVVGPNVKAQVITGGGSAELKPLWAVSPWQGLNDNKPAHVEVSYSLGASTSKFLPLLDDNFTALDRSPGFDLAHYAIVNGERADRPSIKSKHDVSNLFMVDFYHPELQPEWITELDAIFTSPFNGEYEFSLCVTGLGWLYVDDKIVIDNSKDQVRGATFFGNGTAEVKGRIKVIKGKKYKLKMIHDARVPADVAGLVSTPYNNVACRLGAFPVYEPDQAIADAVTLARQSEIAIVVAGLNSDYESEGFDRKTLSLPLRTNDLISAVADANPNTVVVIQAGSAVSMPWLDKVAGVLYAWYGGNETGNAIADIIYGKANPSGRLPISLPKREIDIAANNNFKSARTKVMYSEGIWVGYKHHNANGIEPLFPFGHGLSYTSFAYSQLKITHPPPGPSIGADAWSVGVSVVVTNTGETVGSHSVHFYTSPPCETTAGLKHPQWELRAFEKVYDLQPGQSTLVEVKLDKYAVTHWDELWKTWRAERGEWTVRVGKDAQSMYGEAKFTIDQDLEWIGL